MDEMLTVLMAGVVVGNIACAVVARKMLTLIPNPKKGI